MIRCEDMLVFFLSLNQMGKAQGLELLRQT